MQEYEAYVKTWVERIASRVKLVLEGLSTTLVENFTITGGGSILPGVYEMFKESFRDIGDVKRPDEPIKANSIGYYMLAKSLVEEEKRVESETESGSGTESGVEAEILDAEETKKRGKSKK